MDNDTIVGLVLVVSMFGTIAAIAITRIITDYRLSVIEENNSHNLELAKIKEAHDSDHTVA